MNEVAEPTVAGTTVAGVLAELAALHDPRARALNQRHGDDHGVNLSWLRALAIHAATARSNASASTRARVRRIVDSHGRTARGSIPWWDDAVRSESAARSLIASDGDYVHVSTYAEVRYASGHGFWWNVTCPTSYRENVTIWLEEKLGTSWYPQGDAVTGYKRLPGSGSTQRVNAKMRCVNSTTHQWRSIIVADIVGHADTAPAAYTAARSLACY